MAETEIVVSLTQEQNYRFHAEFEGPVVPPVTLDEPAPTGGSAGPSPAQSLAVAVGHCMSSTLFSCCQRSHVAVRPMRTTVRPVFGRNDRGRLRVVRLDVSIHVEPVDLADAPKVRHCLEIFEDLCPVSGAVRDGAKITLATSTESEPAGM
jgi:uncharacterized OsmC-like protein